MIPRFLFLRLRFFAGVGFVASTSLLGCSAAPRPAPVPFVAGGPAAPQMAVHKSQQRPALTVIRRAGDPEPSVVVALASGLGADQNAGLAILLERRMLQLGYDVVSESDGIGVRLQLWPGAKVNDVFEDFRTVLQSPVGPDELDIVSKKLNQEPTKTLEDPSRQTLARCSGAAASLAQDTGASLKLESWRRSALGVERLSFALVVAEADADAAADGMQQTGSWAQGTPLAAESRSSKHAAYRSVRLGHGELELEAAFWANDAIATASVAHRLRGRSPLTAKLSLLDSPWTLSAVVATTRPRGACLSFRLSGAQSAGPQSTSPVLAASQSAAAALRVVERELKLQLAQPADPFAVTRDIIGAGDASQAARRAAWWGLHRRGNGAETLSSALALPHVEVAEGSSEPITPPYQRALETVTRGERRSERRAAVEVGQGQIWILAASPCATLTEQPSEQGLAGLTALAVAATGASQMVRATPWVRGAGVGLLLSTARINARESPEELAIRAGNELGRALATVPSTAGWSYARRTLLRNPQTEDLLALATLLAPRSPSTVAPWADQRKAVGLSQAQATASWRALLQGPLRIAVLSPQDKQQAESVATQIDHWLPAQRSLSCPTAPPIVSGHSAQHGIVMLSAASRDSSLLELSMDLIGMLQPSAQLSLTEGVGAVSLLARTGSTDWPVMLSLLQRLRTTGPSDAELLRVQSQFLKKRRKRLRSPAARLAQLWHRSTSSLASSDPPGNEALRRWLRAVLTTALSSQ